MAFKTKGGRKKFSLNERVKYHDSKCDSLIEKNVKKGKRSDVVYFLIKRRDYAYSQGYVDGARGTTQFGDVEAFGGNTKAYEAGVKRAREHSKKIRDLKF